MKLTALIFLTFPVVCFSQRNYSQLLFAKMETYKINSLIQTDSLINLPFKNYEVWDVRGDTSSIGFSSLANGTAKINFKNGLKSEIDSFVKYNYTFHRHYYDTTILVILIKNFRISNFIDINNIAYNNLKDRNAGIKLNAELFLFNGNNYHALYKIDTTLFIESVTDFYLHGSPDIFHFIFYKTENKSFSDLHIGKTEFSFKQMQEHANEFSKLPILKKNSFRKGVYRTFNEFKNNVPSITNFTIQKNESADVLFVIENNQRYPLQNCWGYSDGNSLYIHSFSNFFPLKRVGNTFNIVAIKSSKEKKVSASEIAESIAGKIITKNNFPLAIPYTKTTVNTSAFQLDIQTGEIY